MQCAAKDREQKGAPWVQCPAKATKTLATDSWELDYCDHHAQRFLDVFPKNTFRVRKIT